MRLRLVLIRSKAMVKIAAALAFLACFCTSACADDDPFLSADPASVPPKGEIDLRQWFTWAAGHTGESYGAFETQTEFDFMATDRLQLALALVNDWTRTRPAGAPAAFQDFPGLAGEVLYQVLPPDKSPFGMTLTLDPAVNAQTRSLGIRVLVQKQTGPLEHVLNIQLENDWSKDGGQWNPTSAVTFNYGVAVALDKHWSLALELGNEFAFEQLLVDGALRHYATTFFLGPTVQYDCEFAVVTLGAQAQLPWSSGRNAAHGFTADAERWRLGLRFARPV